MKILLFIITIILIWGLRLEAQSDSNYYPLQIGNYWEYWGSEYEQKVKWYAIIKSDTLMVKNGKKYFAVYNNYQVGSGNVEYWDYLRNEGDSLVLSYVDEDSCKAHEGVIYNFTVSDSSMWPVCGSIFGNHPPELRYYYAVYNTFMDYYPGFSFPVESKRFTNVVIKQVNGKEETTWDPYRGIGRVVVAKGLGKVSSHAELSPLWQLTGAIINGKKYGTITGIDEPHPRQLIPEDFSIAAYPNPFNNRCKLNIKIPEEGNLTISVYNMLGQQVKLIHSGKAQKGNFNFDFIATDLSSGAYTVVAQINSKLSTIKTFLLK